MTVKGEALDQHPVIRSDPKVHVHYELTARTVRTNRTWAGA